MALHRGDMRAAFVGLVAGSVTIFLILYTIVHFTNRKFEGHKAEAAATAGH